MFIDSHVHLDDRRFASDLPDVITRARDAGVAIMINAGADLASSRRGIELARAYPGCVFATVGIHPHDSRLANAVALGELEKLMSSPGVVAFGEIGLDYHYDFSPRPDQIRAFEDQLSMAVQAGMPVVLHMREATRDTLEILNRHKGRLAGVMHCFSGSWEVAREVMDLGLYLGFDGPITFDNAAKLRDVAAKAPLDRILIETDCPYLTPVPHRGKRNEPAYVVEVAGAIARLKNLDREEIAHQTANNARNLFTGLRGTT